MNTILKVFYEKVIPGVLEGEVDCEILIHIIFNVYFKDTNSINYATGKYKDVLLPILFIDNKDEFEKALVSYIETALDFYMPNYQNENDMENEIGKLICFAFANMGITDYQNPVLYFNNLTQALKNLTIEPSKNKISIGFSPIANGTIAYQIDKDTPNNEGPYKYTLFFQNNNDEYEFQSIRFYILENTCFIGAIQGKRERETTPYQKKIKRLIYKANENISQTDELYNCNPGSIVALTSFIALLNTKGITNVQVLPFNIQRLNDKKILYQTLEKKLIISEAKEKQKQKIVQIMHSTENYFERYEDIRHKLLNALKRFQYHFANSTEIEKDDDLNILIRDVQFQDGNNIFLNEIYGIMINEIEKTNHLL